MKIFTLSLGLIVLFATSSSAQLVDAGFEYGATTGSPWIQASTNYGTPFCNAGCGTCNGPCGAQAGTWYAWFGGAADGTLEEGSLVQAFVIPSGTSASLAFYTKIANAQDSLATEKVDVMLDGTLIFSVDCENGENAEYMPQSIDISSYANGAQHTLSLVSFSNNATNILFDSFNLTVDGTQHVGVNDLLNAETEITFYPNPVTDQLMIRFNGQMTGMATVKIVDLNGKIVSSEQLNNIDNGTFNFNAKVLPNGIYNVVIENGGTSHTERVVIAH